MTIHRPMLRYGVFLFLTATAVLLFSQSASAQWTGNGNDVYKNPTTGNVGIGTNAPSYPLDVQVNAQWVARFKKTDATNGGIIIDAAAAYNPNVALAVNGVVKWYMNNNVANGDTLQFWESTGGNPRFTLTQAGNVGIGTNSPLALLDVRNSDGNFYAGFGYGANKDTYLRAGNSATGIMHVGDVNTLKTLLQENGGNVGIGTTNPVFDNNAGARYLSLDGGTGGPGEVGTGSNTTGTSTHVGQFSFLNTNLVGSDKRIAAIAGFTDGATNSGRMDFYAKSAGSFGPPTMSINSSNVNVTGSINVSGNINAKYQDVAEWVPSSEKLAAGTVVVLDQTKSNQVIASSSAYDTRVAGVISSQSGITLGEKSDSKVLVATTGRVRVRVDASRGPIAIGDLLVTSDVPGVAMKSIPVEFAGRKMHMPGTIIGKALEPLAKGKGEVLVLLSLQ